MHLCVDAVAVTFDDIASRKFGEKFVTFAPNLVAVVKKFGGEFLCVRLTKF